MLEPHRRSRAALRATGLLLGVSVGAACGPDGKYRLPEERLEIPVRRAESRRPEDKLPAELLAHRGSVRVLVDLVDQVDLERLGRRLAERRAGRSERRRVVASALARVADRSQSRLREWLAERRGRGEVGDFRGFSIVNRMMVEGTAEAMRALAQRHDVAVIVPESESKQPTWTMTEEAEPGGRTSWAIPSIRAGVAWRQGWTGAGVVVGIIDAGASAAHEQLAPGFRGGPDSWHDPAGGAPEPVDGALGHGTGVLSAAVGANVGGVTLGVAPGATWVACAGLPDGHFNNVRMTECADWMLTVARPDVLVNAWYLPEDGCDRSLQPLVEAWRAAEILPVFAAGNLAPGQSRSPANYVGLLPDGEAALAVGAFREDGELYELSATGPGDCAREGTFPSLVAPGHDVIAALPLTASTYRQVDGTSQAAGFVAGAAAVLLERHPEALASQLQEALLAGAVDLGPPGPDHRFGRGRLDLPRALQALDRLRAMAAAASSTENTTLEPANQSP